MASNMGDIGSQAFSTRAPEEDVDQTNKPVLTTQSVSTGADISIAAIWISVCSLLGFLAWLLITHLHVNRQDGIGLVFAYCFFAFIVGIFAVWATTIVRTGRE